MKNDDSKSPTAGKKTDPENKSPELLNQKPELTSLFKNCARNKKRNFMLITGILPGLVT